MFEVGKQYSIVEEKKFGTHTYSGGLLRVDRINSQGAIVFEIVEPIIKDKCDVYLPENYNGETFEMSIYSTLSEWLEEVVDNHQFEIVMPYGDLFCEEG